MTGTHPVEREEVMAWLDGELPGERGAVVASHIAACADCGALAAELREASAQAAMWTVDAAPATLQAPVARRRSRVTRMVMAASGTIAVAAAATFVVVVWRGRHDAEMRIAAPGATVQLQSRQVESLGYVSGRPRLSNAAGTAQKPGGIAGSVAGAAPAPAQDLAMIAKSASLTIASNAFDGVRAALDRVVAAEQGAINSISTGGEAKQRWVRASLRVPAARLDATLAALRTIGTVKEESQAADDVTDGYRDLSIRIRNARVEEQRLNELLRGRTGTVKDVLEVEQHIARVRTNLEQMESEALATRTRVAMATIAVEIDEIYKADLAVPPGSLPFSSHMRNALVDGTRASMQIGIAIVLGVLTMAPILAPWVVVLIAARAIWRRRVAR